MTTCSACGGTGQLSRRGRQTYPCPVCTGINDIMMTNHSVIDYRDNTDLTKSVQEEEVEFVKEEDKAPSPRRARKTPTQSRPKKARPPKD